MIMHQFNVPTKVEKAKDKITSLSLHSPTSSTPQTQEEIEAKPELALCGINFWQDYQQSASWLDAELG
jgi:hypothetical protein